MKRLFYFANVLVVLMFSTQCSARSLAQAMAEVQQATRSIPKSVVFATPSYIGPGPRNDGKVYVDDYVGTNPISCTAIHYVDSSTGIQNAMYDASLTKTHLVFGASVYWAANVNWLPAVTMEGRGVSYNDHCGTSILGTQNSGQSVFILANGGPYHMSEMAVTGSFKALYAPGSTTDFQGENVAYSLSDPTGNVIDFPSTNNYPFTLNHFHINGGCDGINFGNHIGSATITQGKIAGQKGTNCYPIKFSSNAQHVTNQFVTICDIDFSIPEGPAIYIQGNFWNLEICRSDVERYSQAANPHPLADIVFGPNTSGGSTYIHDNVLGQGNGVLDQFAIYDMPGYSRLAGNILGTPVASHVPIGFAGQVPASGIVDEGANTGLVAYQITP